MSSKIPPERLLLPRNLLEEATQLGLVLLQHLVSRLVLLYVGHILGAAQFAERPGRPPDATLPSPTAATMLRAEQVVRLDIFLNPLLVAEQCSLEQLSPPSCRGQGEIRRLLDVGELRDHLEGIALVHEERLTL